MVTRNDDSRDDALGRRNSRIARNAAAGTFTAEATTYRAATAGSFRLTVRTLPTAPDKPANGRSSVGADDGLVTLSWNASAGAATHRVTLSGSSWSATVDAPAASQTVPASALAVRSGLRVAYVEACNAEGACSARTSIAFRPPPPAPSGIVAVADGSTEVDLTWNSVANATRYEVEYKTTASDAWIDHPGSTTATSTSVAGLECGTGDDFRVRAHGDGTNRASHWGPWSATASEDTEACVVNRPGAPANVALTVRDRQLEVAWDTPTSDGGSPVLGHQFRYRMHGTQTWTESDEYTTASRRDRRSASDELGLAQRVIGGLDNGMRYYVEVRVKNANGYGSWTEQQSVSAAPAAAAIAIESIVDASLEVGGSTVFSVRAENLSTTVDYTIRLSTSDTGADAGVLKFNSCGTNAADSIDFSIGTNASAVTIRGALAVYGCAEGGDDLRATLSGGTGTSPSATQAITVTESASSTSIALTGLSAGFNHVKVSWELTAPPVDTWDIVVFVQPNPGCVFPELRCPTKPFRITGESDGTAEFNFPVKMDNDIDSAELPSNTLVRLIVKAEWELNGEQDWVESSAWDVTTLPVIGQIQKGTDDSDYSELIWNTTSLNLTSSEVGLDAYEFGLRVPRESGFQIVDDETNSCIMRNTVDLVKVLISCNCDYDPWSDIDTAWGTLPFKPRIVRCARGDGNTPLQLLARLDATDARVVVDADLGVTYGDADYEMDGVVKFAAPSPTPEVTQEVDFTGSIATAAALWNEADVNLQYEDFTDRPYNRGDVVIIAYASETVSCSGKITVLACVWEQIQPSNPIPGGRTMVIGDLSDISVVGCTAGVQWSSSTTSLALCDVSLLHAIVHEFGHAAWLYDSADENDLMYLYISAGDPQLVSLPGGGFVETFGTQELSAMDALYPSADGE